MSLQKQINEDFVTAFKAKDSVTKDCLGLLKTKISEFLKQNNGTEIADSDVLTIIASETKKRKQAIDLYSKNDSEIAKANATKEQSEIEVLAKYLPAQLSPLDIASKIVLFRKNNEVPQGPAGIGMLMKYFNANFKGQFDNATLKTLIESSI